MKIRWIKRTTSTVNYISYFYNSKNYLLEIEYDITNKRYFKIGIIIKGVLHYRVEPYSETHRLYNLNNIVFEAESIITTYLKKVMADLKKEARRVYEVDMKKVKKIENFILK